MRFIKNTINMGCFGFRSIQSFAHLGIVPLLSSVFQLIKNTLIKKYCSMSTLHETGLSLWFY